MRSDPLLGGLDTSIVATLASAGRPLLAVTVVVGDGVLDEPTVHLDPVHQRAMLVRLGRIAREQGRVCIAVLHDLNLASALCDRVVVIGGGRIVADGTPRAVLTQHAIDRVFGPGLHVLADRDPPAVVPVA